MRLTRLLAQESPVLFALAIIGSLLSGIAVLGVLKVVSLGMHPRGPHANNGEILLWLALTAVGSRWGASLALGHLSRAAMFRLRLKLSQKIATAPFPEFEEIGTTRLIAIFTQDIADLAAILPNVVALLSNSIFLLLTLGMLALISPIGAEELVALLLAGYLLKMMLEKTGRRRRQLMNQEWERLLHVFESLIFGLKEVHLDVHRRDRVLAKMRSFALRLRDSSKRQSFFYVASANGVQLTFFLALWVEVFSGWGYNAHNADGVATYGLSIIYIMLPLQSVLSLAGTFASADEILHRLGSIDLDKDGHSEQIDAVLPAETGRLPSEALQEVALDGVTFHYESDDNAAFSLGPVNLQLRRGEIVFITGGNGCGKTTLAKLLTGLYAPHEGAILVDGRPLGPGDMARYRNSLAAIYGDFYSFDDLAQAPSTEELQSATGLLARLGISHVVSVSPDGMFSRTRGLSSGERKRLALMVALLQDRVVYLFDEWAADQDPVFKDIFYRSILPDLKANAKLVIAITHDDRYFDLADQLVILERSRLPVVERQPKLFAGSMEQADDIQMSASLPI